MERELWGTFSVTDHLRPRAFVADVILYDRLVIPQPPELDSLERARWECQHWDPKRQAELLKRLEDLAVPIPWTEQRRASWEEKYTSERADQRAEARLRAASKVSDEAKAIIQAPDYDPMHCTRELLQDEANKEADSKEFKRLKALLAAPGAEVEAIAAYGSYAEFNNEIPVLIEPATIDSKRRVALFGWESVVPEDSDLTDYELLKKAVDLAKKEDFKENRALFHKWRRQITAGEVDVQTAIMDLEKRLNKYGKMVRSSGLRTKIVYTISAAAASANLLDFVAPGVGVVTSAFLALGALAADRYLPNRTPNDAAKVAAIFYDARKQFGWR